MQDRAMNEAVAEKFNRINRYFGANHIRLLMVQDNCLVFDVIKLGVFLLSRGNKFTPNGRIDGLDTDCWNKGIIKPASDSSADPKVQWLESIADGKEGEYRKKSSN